MTDHEFLITAIDKREKRVNRVFVENTIFGGMVGALAGYLLSTAYTACMLDGAPLQIAMTVVIAALGLGFGYFDGKAKSEELRLDLLLLRHLAEEGRE